MKQDVAEGVKPQDMVKSKESQVSPVAPSTALVTCPLCFPLCKRRMRMPRSQEANGQNWMASGIYIPAGISKCQPDSTPKGWLPRAVRGRAVRAPET